MRDPRRRVVEVDRLIAEREGREIRLPRGRDLLAGGTWMAAVTLLLFFFPILNGLLGGWIGGYRAGTVRRAFLAATAPTLVVAGGLALLYFVLGAPVTTFLTPLSPSFWLVLSVLGLWFGAGCGGASAEKDADERMGTPVG